MSMCSVISCVVGRGCLLWLEHSLAKTVSLYTTSFCTAKPNLPVTPGISCLLLHSSPLWQKGHLFWVLVLENLPGLHRTIQLKFLKHYWLVHRLGLLWCWMVLLIGINAIFFPFLLLLLLDSATDAMTMLLCLVYQGWSMGWERKWELCQRKSIHSVVHMFPWESRESRWDLNWDKRTNDNSIHDSLYFWYLDHHALSHHLTTCPPLYSLVWNFCHRDFSFSPFLPSHSLSPSHFFLLPSWFLPPPHLLFVLPLSSPLSSFPCPHLSHMESIICSLFYNFLAL